MAAHWRRGQSLARQLWNLMLAALIPSLFSTPVTVAMHGVALAVHCLVSRSLSAAANPLGSILVLMLAGVPIVSWHDLAFPHVMRPGPTLVVTGCPCAEAALAASTAMPRERNIL